MPFKIITSKFSVVISLPKHLIFMGNIHASNIFIFSSFILTNFMCKTHLPLHLCLYLWVKLNLHIKSKAFEIHGVDLCYQYFNYSFIHYYFLMCKCYLPLHVCSYICVKFICHGLE